VYRIKLFLASPELQKYKILQNYKNNLLPQERYAFYPLSPRERAGVRVKIQDT